MKALTLLLAVLLTACTAKPDDAYIQSVIRGQFQENTEDEIRLTYNFVSADVSVSEVPERLCERVTHNIKTADHIPTAQELGGSELKTFGTTLEVIGAGVRSDFLTFITAKGVITYDNKNNPLYQRITCTFETNPKELASMPGVVSIKPMTQDFGNGVKHNFLHVTRTVKAFVKADYDLSAVGEQVGVKYQYVTYRATVDMYPKYIDKYLEAGRNAKTQQVVTGKFTLYYDSADKKWSTGN